MPSAICECPRPKEQIFGGWHLGAHNEIVCNKCGGMRAPAPIEQPTWDPGVLGITLEEARAAIDACRAKGIEPKYLVINQPQLTLLGVKVLVSPAMASDYRHPYRPEAMPSREPIYATNENPLIPEAPDIDLN